MHDEFSSEIVANIVATAVEDASVLMVSTVQSCFRSLPTSVNGIYPINVVGTTWYHSVAACVLCTALSTVPKYRCPYTVLSGLETLSVETV